MHSAPVTTSRKNLPSQHRSKRLLAFAPLLVLFVFASTLQAQYYIQPGRYARPNYARPNYSNPNYARPNYGNPNYANPNYANPNYVRPNYVRPNHYVPNGTRPRYGTNPRYTPVPRKTVDNGSFHKPVTPEEAQKLYNRPKTNPPPDFDPKSPWPRIAGEFEKQNAILISVSELLPQHGNILKRIAELTEDHVPLVILFNNTDQVVAALKVLNESDQELKHISFMHFELDTVWLRDFGPVLAEKEDGVMSIDFFYNGQRPTDDHFPRDFAKLTDAEHNSVPWTIQGGNLLCNGEGLALTTTRIFDDNKISLKPRPGVDVYKEQREFVINEFKKYTNLKHIEVLQPLQSEQTKHVDMFATFVSSREVLVAKVDPRLDPVNARILDYNADRLEKVRIAGKPIKVHRIPIPVRRGTSWSPYTNIIIANKLIMMPVMKTDDRATMMEAINIYRETFPNHRVTTVDISTMAKLQGALHCMSIHVPKYVDLPEDKLVSYQRAAEWGKRDKEKKEDKNAKKQEKLKKQSASK